MNISQGDVSANQITTEDLVTKDEDTKGIVELDAAWTAPSISIEDSDSHHTFTVSSQVSRWLTFWRKRSNRSSIDLAPDSFIY